MEIAFYLFCLNLIRAIPTESNFVASIEKDPQVHLSIHSNSATTQKGGGFVQQIPLQIQNIEE
jgi:hypothetical protein